MLNLSSDPSVVQATECIVFSSFFSLKLWIFYTKPTFCVQMINIRLSTNANVSIWLGDFFMVDLIWLSKEEFHDFDIKFDSCRYFWANDFTSLETDFRDFCHSLFMFLFLLCVISLDYISVQKKYKQFDSTQHNSCKLFEYF